MSDTMIRPAETTHHVTTTDDGDHDRFKHYVPKKALGESILDGVPVRALCGKLWNPTRDPDRYPMCPTCEKLFKEKFPD